MFRLVDPMRKGPGLSLRAFRVAGLTPIVYSRINFLLSTTAPFVE